MNKRMRKSKLFLFLIVILSIAVFSAGCLGPAPESSDDQQDQAAEEQEEQETTTEPVKKVDAEIVIKLGHCDTDINIIDSPYKAYAETFQSIIESKTGGRIGVEIFPNSQLGDLRSQMEQTANGDIQMLAGMTVDLFSTYNENVQVLAIPYSFQNTEVGRKVLDGEFGQEMAEEIAEDSNLRVVSWLPTAFRNFSNNKRPIKTPADMEGLKMRTMQVPIHMAMVKALGANPTAIPWEELYSAMQTGVADGQENPPYAVVMAKLYEVQKYYTLDNHLLNIACVVMNDDFLNSLSESDQEIVKYAARQAQMALLGIVAAKESGDLKTIADAGVEIYSPTSEEFNMFREAVQGPVLEELEGTLDQEWVDKFFDAIDKAEKETGLQ